MIVIPQNTQLTKQFKELIHFFNELEKSLEYPNCEGYSEQRMALINAEKELIMQGKI